jgi:hypothetical protein
MSTRLGRETVRGRALIAVALASLHLGCAGGVCLPEVEHARSGYGPRDAQTIDAAIERAVHEGRAKKERWEGPEGDFDVVSVESLDLRIAATCVHDDRVTCAALDALLAAPGRDFDIGPGDASHYYCKPLGGKPVEVDGPHGRTGFCRFADDSWIEARSLVFTPIAVLGKEKCRTGCASH